MNRPGRPRTFDEDALLNAVTDHFWRRGYAKTSMQDLGQHTGVLPGSLYAAFGNKQAVFTRALQAYASRQREFGEHLASAKHVLPVLRRAFHALLAAAVENPGRGCMLGNTAAELVPEDQSARAIVGAAFREFEESIGAALGRGQLAGEVRADIDCAAHARMLVALMQGLHVVARAEADPRRLMDAVDVALAPISAPATMQDPRE